MGGCNKRTAICKPGREISPAKRSASTLILLFSQPSELQRLSLCCFGHQVYGMVLEQPELPETSSEQRGHSNTWLNLGDGHQRPSSVFPIFPKPNGTKTFFSELRALAYKRL